MCFDMCSLFSAIKNRNALKGCYGQEEDDTGLPDLSTPYSGFLHLLAEHRADSPNTLVPGKEERQDLNRSSLTQAGY